MKNYEVTLIVDSQLPEEQVDGRTQKVTAFLQSRGAEVVHVERWGLRKLAYEIGKRQQGVYTLIQFRGEGGLIRDLEGMCRLDEGILRHMVLVRKQFVTREEATRQEPPGGDRPRPVETAPERPQGSREGEVETSGVEDEEEA